MARRLRGVFTDARDRGCDLELLVPWRAAQLAVPVFVAITVLGVILLAVRTS